MKRTLATMCVICACWAADGKRGLTPRDYSAIEIPADPRISPDGKLVAYAVASIDAKQNRRRSAIWLVPVDGSREPWQFTTAENSNAPRWSPDGRTVGFISTRPPAKAQVYALSMSGGEARRITDLKDGVTAFAWSPDGTRIACVSRTGPESGARDASDVRHYLFATYKMDGVGMFDNRRAHIFVVDVKSGSVKQVTGGPVHNDSEPAWSPDGKTIAYASAPTNSNSTQDSELFVVAADGASPNRKISNLKVGIHAPRWSPDGRRIAHIGCESEIAIPKIFFTPASGGTSTLASDKVTFATELEWTHDARGLYYTAGFKGEHPIFRLDLGTHESAALTEHATVRQMDINEATETIAYAAAGDTNPGDIYAMAAGARAPRQLTHINAKLLREAAVAPMERLHYKGPDNWDIEGFLMKPVNFQEGRSYPMILMIHGGPNGMWGFQWVQDAQVFAGHGWAVLLTNPRGSSGYGEAFQRGVDKEWGGKAYADIMAGVDAALAKYPWIDRNRLGVSGHSFGGFMTDWIVGHTTRFKAATTLAGISDFISVEGTRDGFYGHARDFGGDLFQNFDLYWKYSPVRYAKNIKTPTLVLHGENDQRVPLEQGEQFFRALQHFGVQSELVIFPREGHGLRGEPKHAKELAEWQVYWFERFLEGNADAARPGEK